MRPSINPDGWLVVETEHDPEGLVTAVTERGFAPIVDPDAGEAAGIERFRPIERTTRYRYEADRLVAIDGPRDDVHDVTRFAWDEQSRLVAIAPPASPAIRFTGVDAAGRPTGVRLGDASPFELVRDVSGEIVEVRHPTGSLRYEHDPEGRLLATVDRTGHRVALRRDPAGRVVSVIDDLGRGTALGHDRESRVTSRCPATIKMGRQRQSG